MIEELSQLITGTTGPTAFAVAAAGGLVAGFGPCVLPLLPVVFGYVTGQTANDVAAATANAVGPVVPVMSCDNSSIILKPRDDRADGACPLRSAPRCVGRRFGPPYPGRRR